MNKNIESVFVRWQEKLNRGETMKHIAFEGDMENSGSGGYQLLKSIIITCVIKKQYLDVCFAYVKVDNEKFNDGGPMEFHSIIDSPEYKTWLNKQKNM